MTNQAFQLPFRRVGADVQVWPGARIIGAEQITLGNSVIVDDFVFLMGGEDTQIGDFVHIAAFSSLVGGGRLYMEDFSGISGGVRLYSGNEQYDGSCLTNPTVPPPYRQPIRSTVRLGRHAIVGANSVILPGVTIGEGAVVGANSLVGRDCKPWTVYIGTPAVPIAGRPRETILRLEEQLRAEAYDPSGNYIPAGQRPGRGS